MKRPNFTIALMAILLLLPFSSNAKMYMGTIDMQVGDTRNVDSEPSTYYTVSGSWSKSGNAITITSRSNRYCTIKAISAGTSTLEWSGLINATWADMYWTVNVTPAPVKVTKIELNKSQLTLKVNEQEYLVETISPYNASDKSVSWTSGNPTVAEVNGNGLVTAKRTGSTTITCKANDGSGKYATCDVTVNPEEIPTTIADVAAGSGYSMIIDKNGTLWGCGHNDSGQLGDGTREDRLFPTKIMNNVASVAPGTSHTLILKNDASLWACGRSLDGQLGIENRLYYGNPDPTKVTDDVAAIAAGQDFSLIVKKDGSLWACGRNWCGQLGDGTNTDRKSLVKITDNVIAVATGESHSVILKKDGSLWTWGNNDCGQLGDGTKERKYSPVKVLDDVASIAAGYKHTIVIKQDGSLWTCGLNGNGQLGINSYSDSRSTFVKVMDNVAYVGRTKTSVTQVIKNDGSYWACGWNGDDNLGGGQSGQILVPFKVLDDVSVVSSGSLAFTLLVKKDGSLWVCGRNYYGQLGDGTTEDCHTLKQIVKGDGQSQGISTTLMTREHTAHIYSLAGQRLAAPHKGINIIGGKKVVVK